MRKKIVFERKKLISLFCLLLIIALGIGYAVLSEQLKVNGSVNYDSIVWDVGFVSATDGGGSVNSNPQISNDKKSISISCDLGTSLDQETCIAKANIKNASTFAVQLDDNPLVEFNNTYINSVDVIWSDDENSVEAYDEISANSEREIKLIILTKELTSDMLPESNLSLPITITMNWVESQSVEVSLKGKTVAFFGDSVSYGYLTDGNGFGYYVDQLEDLASYGNYAVASATLNTSTQTVNNVIEQMMNHKDESFDYVIMQGGFGDLRDMPPLGQITSGYNTGEFDTTTFAGAVEYMLYLATTYWEDAKIGFIVSYFTPNSNSGVRANFEEAKKYWDILKAACDKWNVDYLDLFEGTAYYNGVLTSFNDILKVSTTTYIPDGVHLNEAGYELLTPYIVDWIKTLSKYYRNFEITENDNGIIYPDPTGYTVVSNFADLTLTKDQSIGKLSSSQLKPVWSGSASVGRATAVNYLVRVTGGETLGLTSVAVENNIFYAIGELDINASTINPAGTVGEGQVHGEWLSDDLTLNTKTKYIVVSFKNGDGTTSFTNEQISLLPTYLEFK